MVRITVNPGESFLDRMIGMVEAAKRQKTPNEVALTILLVALTIVFLVVTVTLLPFSLFSVQASGAGSVVSLTALIALLVCLIPTTIGGLLSAIGIAGMDRLVRLNVIATSGRAVEAAGDVHTLLLDKTGTITFGNRRCSALYAAQGITPRPWPRAPLCLAGRRDPGRPFGGGIPAQPAPAGRAAAGPGRGPFPSAPRRACRVSTGRAARIARVRWTPC